MTRRIGAADAAGAAGADDTTSRNVVRVSVELFEPPVGETVAVISGIERAASRYAAFLGRELELGVRSQESERGKPKPPTPPTPSKRRSP